jgi:hypothetical protein
MKHPSDVPTDKFEIVPVTKVRLSNPPWTQIIEDPKAFTPIEMELDEGPGENDTDMRITKEL